jgi:hypothetical protein
VGRQREWLADASSVQFTRQTSGLVGALRKIAGLPTGSALSNRHGAKQVSHMLFGDGTKSLSSLYATHPPLLKRIAALDPTVTEEELAGLAQKYAEQPPDGVAEDAAMGLVGGAPARPVPAPAPATVQVDPEAIRAKVGSVSPDDLARGVALSARIPAQFRSAASQGSTAVPLVLSMLLDDRPEVRERQLQRVLARLGQPTMQATAAFAEQLPRLDAVLRLPIAALATPQLTARPPAQRATVVATLDELARADGQITVFEYCLTRLVSSYLTDAGDPQRRSRRCNTRRRATPGRPWTPAGSRSTPWIRATSRCSWNPWWQQSRMTGCSPRTRQNCCGQPARCCAARCHPFFRDEPVAWFP